MQPQLRVGGQKQKDKHAKGNMKKQFNLNYLESVRSEFKRYRNLGIQSIQSLSMEELNSNINNANSISIIVKHLNGNMKSRWVNLFTEDGEKPNRNRDREFEEEQLEKEKIIELYNEGFLYLEEGLSKITENDFTRPVIILKEPHSLVQALNRQISHCSYHIGQIVIIAKQCKGKEWVSLSIPKGKSTEFKQGNYLKQ